MRKGISGALSDMRYLVVPPLLAFACLAPVRASAATRGDILGAAVRAADRLAAVRTEGRTWQDAPYLVGTLLIAEQLENAAVGSGQRFIARAASAIDEGDGVITHGDNAAYAQAALDLYRLASGDTERREILLKATDGAFAFAARALTASPSQAPPAVPWWVAGGYGVRFWVDDLFTLPPWLAMRGSTREGLPADTAARDLAYEWIESYVHDHRPTADGPEANVPTSRPRSGPLLWDPVRELFRHDPGSGVATFWGRGNGWAAWGLARSTRFLDSPYAGNRYDEVLDRTDIRELLSRLAGSLASRRAGDGGWGTDLLSPDACGTSETSATGLITYMLAQGVVDGWLDREVYVPVVLKAFASLLDHLDADGDVVGIQPPGAEPDCTERASDDAAVDLSYGVGAFLLAASEVLKLPESDLATLEELAAEPVRPGLLWRTWFVALPTDCEGLEIRLWNHGTMQVRAVVGSRNGSTVRPDGVVVSPGGGALMRVTAGPDGGGPVLLALRTDGDLDIRPRAVCGDERDIEGEARRGIGRPPKRAGAVVPLSNALAPGEATVFPANREVEMRVGGENLSSSPASLLVEIRGANGVLLEGFSLELPANAPAFKTRRLSPGWEMRLANMTPDAAILPVLFETPNQH